MKRYHTSAKADHDIKEIYKYSARQFGYPQATNYLAELYSVFEMLGDFPLSGHTADYIATTYRQFEHQSHVIFYKKRKADIFIVRVLHARMDPARHLLNL